jgi:hypothetical protein
MEREEEKYAFCSSDCAYRWCAHHRSHILPGEAAVWRDLCCPHYQPPIFRLPPAPEPVGEKVREGGTVLVVDEPAVPISARQPNLRALQAAAEAVIATLKASSVMIPDAVNWARLACVRAERAVDQDDRVVLRVCLVPAAPECQELPRLMGAALAEAGYEDVAVVTEW